MSADTQSILLAKEVIALNQDPLGVGMYMYMYISSCIEQYHNHDMTLHVWNDAQASPNFVIPCAYLL